MNTQWIPRLFFYRLTNCLFTDWSTRFGFPTDERNGGATSGSTWSSSATRPRHRAHPRRWSIRWSVRSVQSQFQFQLQFQNLANRSSHIRTAPATCATPAAAAATVNRATPSIPAAKWAAKPAASAATSTWKSQQRRWPLPHPQHQLHYQWAVRTVHFALCPWPCRCPWPCPRHRRRPSRSASPAST